MSDALVLEYLSSHPNQGGLPHPHYHSHTGSTSPSPPTTTTTMPTPPPFTLHEPHPSHPPTKLPFGRGGAGNLASPARPLPPTTLAKPSSTHNSLHTSPHPTAHDKPHYSTGRGGAGNMHGAGEERRIFSFDEELALQGKVGVPVYHIGRGGRGNVVDEEEEGGRRGSGGSKGSGSGSSGLGEGVRGSLEWIRGLGRKG